MKSEAEYHSDYAADWCGSEQRLIDLIRAVRAEQREEDATIARRCESERLATINSRIKEDIACAILNQAQDIRAGGAP